MTEDVILDVTAEFIRSSESNLKLALQVERAMPSVREHFVRATLEAVEERFPRSEWTIERSALQTVMARNTELSLRNSAWKTYWDEASIWLGSDQPDWKSVWIGLYLTNRASPRVQPVELTMARLANIGYTVNASEDAPGAYKYLDRELRDWSGERFLTRLLKEGANRIASEISAELKKIDEFVGSLD